MSYASSTSVSVERSRGEIERLLMRYGATQFVTGWTQEAAAIGFVFDGRHIRIALPLPDIDDDEFQLTETGRKRKNQDAVLKAWEQACRSRWRALLLVVKAKLEAVEVGISTIEEEFLAWTIVPGSGMTVFQEISQPLATSIESGRAPQLLLGGDEA
ncbi:MAG: hypothetical protein AAF368_16840 [Planctomycetota bacterium]